MGGADTYGRWLEQLLARSGGMLSLFAPLFTQTGFRGIPPLLFLLSLLYAFLLGLIIGSFYTATASRVLYYFYGPGRKHPRRWREFLLRPSFCMECGSPLALMDLIPLVGYLRTKGRCRSCGAPVGLLTLAGELFPGVLFPLLLAAGFPLPAALSAVLMAGHLYISMATDVRFFQLDHENTAFLFLWALLGAASGAEFQMAGLVRHLVTAGAVMLFLLLLFFATGRNALGFGDILLGGALSLFFGFPWTLLLFQIASALAILYWLLTKKPKEAWIPFGLFLALGACVTWIAESLWMILY